MKSNTSEHIGNLGDRASREVLRRNYIGSLAYLAQGVPHVLPITYFYDEESGSLISYSSEGHKIRAMRDFPSVALAVYEMQSPGHWKSVMVHGSFQELSQIDAKAYLKRFSAGIRKILAARGVDDQAFIQDFSGKAHDGQIPLVFCVRIEDWTGKYRGSRPDAD